MPKNFFESKLKHFRKDRIWLLVNSGLTSLFCIYGIQDLFSSENKSLIDFLRIGIFFIASAFAAAVFWKSLQMYLLILEDRIQIRGWWREINVCFRDIEKWEFQSQNFSEKFVLHLKRPNNISFQFSWNIPFIILKKNRKVISLSSYLSDQDWTEFKQAIDNYFSYIELNEK